MKNYFKAAVLREHYSPLSIETFKKQSPEKGQVLVKMISSGLCGAQINEIDAVKGIDKYMPHFMGHEGYGKVLEIGEGVTKVKPNDYVVLHWRKGSGCDCFGGKYFTDLGLVGSGPVTTFAEQTIVAENRITLVSPDEELNNLFPLMGCALSTAYGIAKDIKKEQTVLVLGAGGLGLTIAFWLKVLYNTSTIIVDRYESKRMFSEQYGVFHSTEKNSNILKELDKTDIVIDTTGDVGIISSGFSLVRKQGSLILVGQPRVGKALVLENALSIFDGIKIYSSDGGNFDPDRDLTTIVDLVKSNIDLAKTLVTDTIGIEKINEGFDMIRKGKSGRVVINFEELIK